jgi:hypothetical protein
MWQIRFFESPDAGRADAKALPDPRLRAALAVVLGVTVFGSLWAIADEGPRWAAGVVAIGLAVSLLPILLRVLPPLTRETGERDAGYAVTIVGLALYTATVAGFLVLLDVS